MALSTARLLDNLSVGSLVLRSVGLVFVFLTARIVYRGYQVRKLFHEVANKYGVKILPHSWIWGHLPIIGRVVRKNQPDIAGQLLPMLLLNEYPELRDQGALYVDSWPFGPPMLAVVHPDMMSQFTQERSLPKADLMKREFRDFSKCLDLVTSEGAYWKYWRAVFNPGFSAKNLAALVPSLVEEIAVFRERLIDTARRGEVVKLDPMAISLAIDVIVHVVLGVRLGSQTDNVAFVKAFNNQVDWLVTTEVFKEWHPLRPFQMWRNERVMRSYLAPHIERAVEAYRAGERPEGPSTVLWLAIAAYFRDLETDEKDKDPAAPTAPAATSLADFVDNLYQQLKVFIFGGHDTTATTLCYCYDILARHPAALEAVRAEHDAVLGPDPAAAGPAIAANPQLLWQMPYTTAVIKETLRLFAPVGTIRQGQADMELTHPDKPGLRFPTRGLLVFSASFVSQRMEEYWGPRVDEFLPERWLAREGDPLHVSRRNAFRPFEHGPRNCIGQELTQLEMRAALAMTLREVDVQMAYSDDAVEVLGVKSYQTGSLAPHPKDGMPIRPVLR